MNKLTHGRLRSNVVLEPLWNQWYAWSYLIPPLSAARYLTESHLPVMQSFVDAPQVHVETLRDPEMIGGPFIQYPVERADEVRSLLNKTKDEQRPLQVLSHAISQLNALLISHPRGDSLEPLYEKIPSALRGYVELVYDALDSPSARIIEALIYQSEFYRKDNQSIALKVLENIDQREFVMSTPRLERDWSCNLPLAFNENRIDVLTSLRTEVGPVAELCEDLSLNSSERERFLALFTTDAYNRTEPYNEDDVRVRYMGHACVLVETRDTVVLVDPIIAYENPKGIDRLSYKDLPEKIDYVLITHNHQDHIMFETLLQLRYKVSTIVIARGQKGSLLDPSLKLLLQQLGFSHVIELNEMESLEVEGGQIIGLPVLGEHGDLNIGTKCAYWIELNGRSVVCAADSNNLDNRLYQNLHYCLGEPDMLFIGMECDGAPYNWSYGPLLPKPVAHRQAQSRRLDGSNAARAIELVDILKPNQVCVYAMGQEPWLNFITSIHYTDTSEPIIESNNLITACREKGIQSERMLGCRDFILTAMQSRKPQKRSYIPIPPQAYEELEGSNFSDTPLPHVMSSTTAENMGVNETAQAEELTSFLKHLKKLKVKLWLEGEQLKCNAPKGVLTSELTAELRNYKPSIISLLKGSRDENSIQTNSENNSETVNWKNDVVLDEAITPNFVNDKSQSPIANILLTGGSGFLGAYLIIELLRQTDAIIHCLVRANSADEAFARIKKNLEFYGLSHPDLGQRVIGVPGNLAVKNFGLPDNILTTLSNTVDAIYHNGAHVHHGLPYANLKAVNVEGTRQLLSLACQENLPFHYISTLSVLPASATTERNRFFENDNLNLYPAPQGGYNLSKWVAERLVRSAGGRGLKVTIYRPGPVSGDSQTGAFNLNDFLYRLMSGYVQSGMAPDGETLLDLLPIDFLAKAIISMSLDHHAAGQTYHLLHPNPVSSEVLFEVCKDAGHPIERVPYDQWFSHLSEIARNDDDHALFPLVALFSSRRGQQGEVETVTSLPFDTSQAQAALSHAGLQAPALDKHLFETYFNTMLSNNKPITMASSSV